MEVVSGDNWTTGAMSHAKLQSNHHHQHPVFLQAGCYSCRPTNSVKALEGKYRIPWIAYPKLTWGLSALSLATPDYLRGGLPCLSSAL